MKTSVNVRVAFDKVCYFSYYFFRLKASSSVGIFGFGGSNSFSTSSSVSGSLIFIIPYSLFRTLITLLLRRPMSSLCQLLFVSSFWVILSRCEVYFCIYLLNSNLFPAVKDLTDFWHSLCFALEIVVLCQPMFILHPLFFHCKNFHRKAASLNTSYR